VQLNEVSPAMVDAGIQKILSTDANILGTGARAGSNVSNAYSMEKMAFDLKVSGGYAGATAEALFKSSREATKNTIIAKFTQVYYTVAFLPPTPDPTRNTIQGTNFFRDGDQFVDLYGEIDRNNPPLYVSSVSYGRQLFFALTSSSTTSELEAAFKAAYNGGGAEFKADSGATFKDIMQNTKVSYVALGGDAATALQPLRGKDGTETFELMKQAMADSNVARFSSANPPFPTAYTLKYVTDNSPASMTYSVVYDKNDCQFLAAQAYDLKIRFSNIDDDVHLYVAPPGDFSPTSSVDGMEKFYFRGYTPGSTEPRSLTEKIGGENERMFVFRLGNGGCGASSLKAEVLKDGTVAKSGSWDTGGWWVHCGWQLETRFKANKSTGAITPVYSDRLPLD